MLLKVELINESVHLEPNNGNTNIRVDKPKTTTTDTKKELEEAILQRNKRHFAQAKDTLWNKPPLNYIGKHNRYNLFKTKDNKDIKLPPNAFIETKTILELL